MTDTTIAPASAAGPIFLHTDRIHAALAAVVSSKGEDHVYDQVPIGESPVTGETAFGARYLDKDGNPSCLVAQVLALLGVPTDALAEHNGASAPALLDELQAAGLVAYPNAPERLWVIEALDYAQLMQDCMVPYGNILNGIHSKYPGLLPA